MADNNIDLRSIRQLLGMNIILDQWNDVEWLRSFF